MKRKSLSPGHSRLLTLHLMAFIIFSMIVAYSIVQTITYPGNATVPFGVFRPFILERLSLVLLFGITVIVHFLIQQSRTFLRTRAYQNHLNAISHLADYNSKRLEDGYDSSAIESSEFEPEKLKKQR